MLSHWLRRLATRVAVRAAAALRVVASTAVGLRLAIRPRAAGSATGGRTTRLVIGGPEPGLAQSARWWVNSIPPGASPRDQGDIDLQAGHDRGDPGARFGRPSAEVGGQG